MEKKYNLTDIGKILFEAMNTPMGQRIRSGAIGVLGITNPVAGLIANEGNNLLNDYNTFKISLLLEGFSTGLDIEKRLNELYTYVKSSSEKAIIVANLFKQTVNAECPRVCVIYGLILASHMNDNTEFSYDEIIVCKALENATDYDLNNFKEIMENYLRPISNGNRIEFPTGFVNLNEFETTCNWCVYNRIFISHMAGFGETEEGGFDMSHYYYEAKPASVLLQYIKEAQRIWEYS